MSLVIALPFHAGDATLMLKNLNWQAELCGMKPYTAVLAIDGGVSQSRSDDIARMATRCYSKVLRFKYAQAPQATWPQGPNWAFHHTATHMQQYGQPWLWLEPDAVPVKPDWLEQLEAEYNRAGKAFMGFIVPDYGHCNGVAVYPHNTPQRIPKALKCFDNAWDCMMREEMIHDCHHAGKLIAHLWGEMPDGKIHHIDGVPPTFKTKHSLGRIPPTAVLVHRSKDGTLIDRLRERFKANREIPLKFCGADNGGPKVEIFIATCAKDAAYLRWNLESIKKFAHGFNGVTLAVTTDDEPEIRPLANQFRATVVTYDPPPNKIQRHLAAQASKGMADLLCPHADLILFSDSDCVFTRFVSPSEYIKNGKPVLVVRAWADSASNPWQEVTEKALGRKCPWDVMIRHPQVMFPGVLKDMRARIEAVHGKKFLDYVLSCKPEFPWGWSEHESIGSIVMGTPWIKKYEIIDLKHQPRPPDVLRQYWGVGPIDQPQIMPSEGRQIIPLEDIQKVLA